MPKQLRPNTGDARSLPCVSCPVTTPDSQFCCGLPYCDNCLETHTCDDEEEDPMPNPSYSVKILIGATTVDLLLDTDVKEKLLFDIFNEPADHVMEVVTAAGDGSVAMFRAGAVGAVLVRPRAGEIQVED